MAPDICKILVAVDGSEQSLDTVRYVAGICCPSRAEVTLFHVLSPVSEDVFDLRESAGVPEEGASQKWVERRKSSIQVFMDNAWRVLSESGFPADAVRLTVQSRREGIARDILHEARQGYHAVAAGKTGLNPITRLVMGSVAGKLVAALTDTPLWLVEGRPDTRRVLVCLDASPAGMRIVDCVGRFLVGTPAEITLFHVIRKPEPDTLPGSTQAIDESAASQAEMRAREIMVPVFEKAVSSMEKAGIASDRISVKVLSGMATRGGTIFAQGLHGGFGTIVIGRRGVSQVKNFSIGRVPMKLVQLMNEMSVWVVSP